MIFTGELTKNIDGKAEFLDAKIWIYITFEKRDFYDLYYLAQLEDSGLYIASKFERINNRSTQIIYIFTRAD